MGKQPIEEVIEEYEGPEYEDEEVTDEWGRLRQGLTPPVYYDELEEYAEEFFIDPEETVQELNFNDS